jgi:hypothetical protein
MRKQFIPTASHWGYSHALERTGSDGALGLCGLQLQPWAQQVNFTKMPDCEMCLELAGYRVKSMFEWEWVRGKGPLYKPSLLSWNGREHVQSYTYEALFDYGSDYASDKNEECHAPLTFEALQAYFEEHDGSSPEQPKAEGLLFVQYGRSGLSTATEYLTSPIDACRVLRKGFGL